MEYLTIRQAAKRTGLPEMLLRGMKNGGFLPGFSNGNRFYIDVDRLPEVLARMSDERAQIRDGAGT